MDGWIQGGRKGGMTSSLMRKRRMEMGSKSHSWTDHCEKSLVTTACARDKRAHRRRAQSSVFARPPSPRRIASALH
eukprot:3905955-Rhodomonas_salina.1